MFRLNKKQKIAFFTIISVCIAVLFGAFLLRGKTAFKGCEFLPGLFVLLIFTALGVFFTARWVKDWDRSLENKSFENVKGSAGFSECVNVLEASALYQILLFFVMAGCVMVFRGVYDNVLEETWTYLFKADSNSYLLVAEKWYSNSGSNDDLALVFLPGYPLLVKLLNFMVGNVKISSIIVANVSFAFGNMYLYKLLRLDMDRDKATRVMIFFAVTPGMFFYISAMTEGLFLLCSAACIYYVRTGKFLPALIFGAYGSFTRSVGIMLLAPVLYEFIGKILHNPPKTSKETRKMFLNGLCCLGIISGFFAYLLINKAVSGNAFQFAVYQKKNWSQEWDWFFNTADYLVKYGKRYVEARSSSFFGITICNLIAVFGAPALMFYGNLRKIRPSYVAYFIATYFMCAGATWLLSLPRYMSVCFPLTISYAKIGEKNQYLNFASFGLAICASLIYMIMYVLRMQIW